MIQDKKKRKLFSFLNNDIFFTELRCQNKYVYIREYLINRLHKDTVITRIVYSYYFLVRCIHM